MEAALFILRQAGICEATEVDDKRFPVVAGTPRQGDRGLADDLVNLLGVVKLKLGTEWQEANRYGVG